MKYTEKILIGGQALRELGSSRHTNDMDYLVWMEDNYKPFHTFEGNDYINANSSNFFEEIYKSEKGNEVASPQGLFELKAFALIEHYRNGNHNKVNDCVFDLNFLKINFNVMDFPVLKKYATKAEVTLINELIN